MLGRRLNPTTMTQIDRLLPPALRTRRRRRTLVVLADDREGLAGLQLERSRWSRARVVPLVGVPVDSLHDELAGLGAIAVVVDARASTGPAQLAAFGESFLELVRGGTWVALREPGARGPEPLVDLAEQLAEKAGPRRLPRPWREHARSVTEVGVTPELVTVGKRRKHLLRVREAEAPELLRTREPALRRTELARLEGGTIDTSGRMHDYGVLPPAGVPDLLTVPPHTVWRYDGLVHLARGPLAYHRRSVLPDSFRWHLAPRLDAPGLQYVAPHVGRLKDPQPTEVLEGSYFHFLYSNPGHFGHLMTEAVSRLWGWWPAKEADPSLKILCRRRPGVEGPGPEATLLPAFGIDPDDLVWFDEGISVRSLVGCTPMWHNTAPYYAHPAIRDTWARLRTGLVGSEPLEPTPRIFVTRRGNNRPCHNVDEVEQIFTEHGYTVLAPEDLPMAEQARTFAGARVVAGFGGAGMFNMLYTEALETVIVLNQSAYLARNEHLYAAVHGADLHTFWSRPDLDHPPGRTSYRAHQSDWTFDVDLNGEELHRLLDRLG